MLTWPTIVDEVAIADVALVHGAELPDRLLDEPREDGGEGRVERPRIDASGKTFNDRRAFLRAIAAGTVGVVRLSAGGCPSDEGSCARASPTCRAELRPE